MALSVVFLGTPAPAVPALRALVADERFDVRLVVTQPSRPVGRKQILTPPPVKTAADELGLPVIQVEKLNHEIDRLRALPPFDFLVVVAFGQILSQAILDLPKIAAVNVHFSLLPRWRGASPVQHAIAAGDRETGVTIQKMVYELDAGDILAQRWCTIEPEDTTPVLTERLATMGAELLPPTLAQPLHPVAQSSAGITRCKILARADGLVDPQWMTAEEIEHRVRAFDPFPGVTLTHRGRTVKLLQVSMTEGASDIDVPCKDHTHLFVRMLQEPGGKPMEAAAWLRGIR